MKFTSELLYEPSGWRELVIPVAGRGESLRTGLQVRVRDSLRKLLREIGCAIPGSKLDDLCVEIDELDVSRRYSPNLYFAYFGLLQGMARSDARAVVECCDVLRNYLRAPYCDMLEIREEVDDVARSFLHAHRAASRSEASFLEFATSAKDSGAEDDIDPSAVASARRQLAELNALIATSNPDLADELASIVSVLQLMPRSFAAEAASSLSAFGMVLVRPPPNLTGSRERFFYFDRVVHEAAHTWLNLLMTFDPLVTNGATLAPSPARLTLRPVKGVLHAHFVFFRLLHAYAKAPQCIRETHDANSLDLTADEIGRMSLSELPLSFALREGIYFDKFTEGDAVLRSSANFTARGQHFFDAMKETISHV
ncbi:aKG-HExxH-type peptide beta-hydroxylase [Paraburkholderia caribensis]|uniref:aKG-HExxH-type peptide beta-hydroxylase n=1 Tax=Paraburkholderia caribensis TaxID=75105 RepID=UPI0034D232C0